MAAVIMSDPTADRDASVPTEAGVHDTLKYHLLGPSLTKAGQDSVDQQKVSFRVLSPHIVLLIKPWDRFQKLSIMPRKGQSTSTTKNTRTRP
jgi:hypothetical protein